MRKCTKKWKSFTLKSGDSEQKVLFAFVIGDAAYNEMMMMMMR